MEINAGIFKSYDIRGIYPTEIDLPAVKEIARIFWQKTQAANQHLAKPHGIILARDGRHSSPAIAQTVRETLLALGAEVYDLGAVSINELYFATGIQQAAGGIMATASHNPPEYGGLKMVLGSRPQTGALEFVPGKDIYQALQDELVKEAGAGAPISGQVHELSVSEEYLNWLLKQVAGQTIKPFKIVLDAGNGMAGAMAKKILEKLGCQTIDLFLEPHADFPNRNPNPLVAGAADKCGQAVLENQADFGVMFDADGDRLFLVDEKGKFVGGDMTLLLIAKAMLVKNLGAGIVYNLICSHATPELIVKWGGRAIRSEVGYKNMARHMLTENGIMSGEVSGHFAFKEHYYADSAFLALALVVAALSQDTRPVSEKIAEQSLYYRGAEIALSAENIVGQMAKLKEKYAANIHDEMDGLTVEFADWWFNARPSNTEPILRLTLEAADEASWEARKQEVLAVLGN